MENFELYFPGINYSFPIIFVKGTGDSSYSFGATGKTDIRIKDFYISKYPVTQRLWEHIMGNNPSHFIGSNRPVETVSFNDVTRDDGFLNTFNSSNGSRYKLNSNLAFRLPSETEWEYAARGGIYWPDGFIFSGSNDINVVGWYENNAGEYTDPEIMAKLKNTEKGTETHDVGQKLPNQLGICDMCGNVWEWCQDYFQRDIHEIPKDGTAYSIKTNDRVLRGGCHHNWAVHCTVSKRYEIFPEAKDGCIGFRLAASV